jgi:hypothetical protein
LLGAGDAAIFSAAGFTLVNSVRQGHMVFCTSVAFSSEDEGLLSVSGDASMRTLPMKPTGRRWPRTALISSLVALLVALLVQLLLRLPMLSTVSLTELVG